MKCSQVILFATFAVAIAPTNAQAQRQVTATGTRSTAIGIVNGNVVVQGPSNATINSIIQRLNAIKARGGLSENELKLIVDLLNQTIIPQLDSIKGDTSAIRQQLDALNERLAIAADHPDTARDVLRPFLKPAFDLSNSSFPVSTFLDVNGTKEYKLIFSLTGDCELYIDPPRGAGFTVAYGILSDHGTRIFSTLGGTQPHYPPLHLPGGVYQFVMLAKRNAGQYNATISARCS
ncbi:hypothetical protein [Sphingomonas sp. dw_22]|uniref:hypothetical protein n=1 Tax=Sphingomonas sp. dw_22 TaxID=2721175 RepID=UPI001BD42A6A|nr:hypothetical protein [Sphingomonas sp. dw_22]